MCTQTVMTKLTVKFPGQIGTPPNSVGISCPGSLDQGSFLTGSAIGGVLRSVPAIASFRDSSFASQRISVASSKSGLPLTAVAISPDSAIHGCTVGIGGSQSELSSYRCAPGNPVFVPPGTDQIWVTTTAGIPVLSPFDDGLAWDATEMVGVQSTGDSKMWGFPLRLLLIYGQVPQMDGKRAPYHAYIRITNPAGVNLNAFFCVDGRREVQVMAAMGGAPAAVTPIVLSGVYSTTNDSFPNEDNATAMSLVSSNAPTSGAPITIKLFDGSGIQGALIAPILEVSVNSSGIAGATAAHLKITAWD